MQLSKIYSDQPKVFSPISFNVRGDAHLLNVVLGEVRDPKNQKKDSHNLGKTTLLNLIDFLLLKGVTPEHFLGKHRDRFQNFNFYIEVALNAGDYATIRRSAGMPNSVSMARHPNRDEDFVGASEDSWDHLDLSRDEAVALLDGWLDLRPLKPHAYRKAITYFLRSQADYRDELQLQKFVAGKDRDWKPFVAHLFGYSEQPILKKYELDDQIEKLAAKHDEKQAEVKFVEEQLPELVTRISLLTAQLNETEGAIDAFSFDAEEKKLLEGTVNDVEREISALNESLYENKYDQRQINASLSHKDKFDLGEIDTIFAEAKIGFPGEIRRSYEDLVAFNRKVTNERNAALRARLKELVETEIVMTARKRELDRVRESHLSILRGTDSFEKFKELQREVSKQRGQLQYLEEQLKKLREVVKAAQELRELKRERDRAVDEIRTMIGKPTPIFERFCETFTAYCRQVLSHDSYFYLKVNSSGNFDYSIGLSAETGATSSQSEGTSYRKLVCALFDLALLKVYEDLQFFHFVYHDGVFEGLDDRKKTALLDVVRSQIANDKTQYILTLIDSDIPRNAAGARIAFSDEEIVLRLHDGGQDGRLFRMPEF